MQYENYNSEQALANTVPAAAAPSPKTGDKSRASLLLLTLTACLGLILLFLGCQLWRHHDVSGQCSLARSGTTYLDELGDRDFCWDQKANRAKYATFEACLKDMCNLPSEPYFGQCDAVPLAIAGGTLAVAYVLACFVLSYAGDPTMYVASTNLLAAAAFGCAVACFITSFYRWGLQQDDSGTRQDRSVIAWQLCTTTYAQSRGEYKAMTAFAMFVSLSTIGGMIAERYNTPEIAAKMQPRGAALVAEQENFM